MKFSNFLFPESKDPPGDFDVIEESLREAELSEELVLSSADSTDTRFAERFLGGIVNRDETVAEGVVDDGAAYKGQRE